MKKSQNISDFLTSLKNSFDLKTDKIEGILDPDRTQGNYFKGWWFYTQGGK